MPPSLHIILTHGSSIIKNAPLAIGKLSEEALESTHKVIRKFRKHHARTASRLKTNEDVFKRLLINSDPKISKIRSNFITNKNSHSIPEDVKNLIILNNDTNDTNNSINNSNDDLDDNQLMEKSDETVTDCDSDNEIEDILF